MREKLRIRDAFGDARIQVGQLFELTLWAAEFITLFGQYGRDGKVHVWVFDNEADSFRMSKMTIRAFKKLAGFDYCDFVITDFYDPTLTIEELKRTHRETNRKRKEARQKRRQLA